MGTRWKFKPSLFPFPDFGKEILRQENPSFSCKKMGPSVVLLNRETLNLFVKGENMKNQPMIPQEKIASKIYLIRGKRVMLDSDLAELYGVKTKVLNLAVRRNLGRFPDDFMFQLTFQETESLRFQFETSKKGRGGRRYSPYTFTQEGVAMLSGVLNSPRAVQANILIMRAFIKLREMVATNELIRQKIEELEKKYEKHDRQFKVIFEALRNLLEPVKTPKKKAIGFHAKY